LGNENRTTTTTTTHERTGEITMPAFMKVGDIKGAAQDQGHSDWIRIDSMTSPIHRSIPEGAVDQQRARGETTLGDVVVVKQVDMATTKLAEACATGKFIADVQINFCTTVNGKNEPYLTYKLSNVIVTSHSFQGQADGKVLPTEEITFAYTKIEWNYVIIDPQKGTKGGNVPGKYELGKAQ
jgi:type VI secretion system secreted protein Hcp